ncbi:Positive transcriptional regulator, MutR family [Pseudolactococcus laudensis]|uniref:Rgg family transcriptional regulator n=1 Tax=Pseudolactococcus laudensis TaxID=1494461 RepID=UPI0002774E52|nr:Positive transcriptional regulator, MutR family [Lactococcus raffinolactis 4877]
MNFRELGTLYKKVRQSRGYSINDVTSDYLNKSQISKFENGNSMLLLDGFMHAVDGLNMMMSEFFLAIGNFESSSSHVIGEKLQELINCQDIEGLKKLIVLKPRTNERKILNIKVKCAIRELSGENLLTDEDCQFVDKYLTDREEWTMFEINVFSMCLEALDTDLAYQLGLQLIEKNNFYKILPYNAQIVKRTLVNVYVYMILRGRFVYAGKLEKKIDRLINSSDTDEKIVIQIFKKFSKYRQEENLELLSEIVRDIQKSKNLGAQGLAERFEIFLFNDK